MNTLSAKLVRDGNSMAVRIPKAALAMSGLTDDVLLDVKKGQITLRPALIEDPRAGWEEQIAKVLREHPDAFDDPELADWDVTLSDGLDEL